MRIKTLLIATILPAAIPALAEETPLVQRRVVTERITAPPAGVGLYEVGRDGTVTIDWRAVEAMAGTPHRSENGIAQMMIAIRDGKWQPM